MAPSKPSHQEDELIKAVLANDETGVAALIGLNVSTSFTSDLGLSPVVIAAENGFAGCLKLLLNAGADPNKELLNGNYPLRAAIMSGDGECCRLLLEHGASLNHCSARGTPLMAAAAAGDCETLALLLDAGADIEAEAKDGLTALAAAVRENQKEAVRLLLRRGASPTRPNKDGMCPVDLAQDKVLPEVYSLLMQASITHAADEALRSSEVRQAAAREEVEATAAKAAEEAREQLQVSREQTELKIGAIRGESEELLKRLGISRKK